VTSGQSQDEPVLSAADEQLLRELTVKLACGASRVLAYEGLT